MDLFIADLSLSWGDGDDVIDCARRRRPDLAIFLVSGHPRGADAARAAEVSFFLKPVELEVLRSAVDDALQSQQSFSGPRGQSVQVGADTP